MIYVYSDGKKFVKVNGLDITFTKNINKASRWYNKKDALSWLGTIIRANDKMTLRETELILKENV
ncbi:hypothetical protein M0Q50_05235 [bacterium]|jgi:hypothetical protein|nr:hypothetical protein [bacterium]